jgi:hypothetical protein
MADKMVLSGREPEALDYHLMEFFAPGDKVDVIVGLPQDISDEDVLNISRQLSDMGMVVNKIQAGSTPEWPSALQVVFTRPRRAKGVATIPLNGVISSSLVRVGAGNMVGWRMSRG